MKNILEKYAHLLVHYCVNIQPGERLYVSSTTLAEPLIREIYRVGVKAGAHVEVDLAFRGKNRIFINNANEEQLKYVPTLQNKAMHEFDAYLYIRAPFNLREDQNNNADKGKIRSAAMKPLSEAYYKRTATYDLKRNLCQYPTQAAAQNAGMSLEEYEYFIFNACKLFEDDPIQAWLDVRKKQQRIVDLLNSREQVHYKGKGIDIQFNTKGRTWINSDGQTNMPSGEVYTSPVEDSVNGVINFSYPAVYMGHEVEDVTLWVENGEIQKWEAKRGQEFLNHIFALPGTRRFGEAAIGTNYDINKFTKNILFDEKIGGTVHMAIGQSYLQAGGKNQSSVHWDMIAGMKDGGQIFADGEKIYENGQFIF
ncbi:MAG: aminopeptidase [Paraglaciecola sp.]|jgi:aminopeptidase